MSIAPIELPVGEMITTAISPGNVARVAVLSVCGVLDRASQEMGAARNALRQILSEGQVSEDVTFDVLVAAGEAISNGIRYGRGETIRWLATIRRDGFELRVQYATDAFDTTPGDSTCSASDENGRGILLMRALMDEVSFRFASGQVRITLIKRLQE